MLTEIEARTTEGEFLWLSLEDVSSGFIIEDVDGLNPVKATIVSSSFASMDGVQYQSSRREARNLILKLRLEPDYINDTVRDLRTWLYRYFMPKSAVDLRFRMLDGLEVDISGRVESFDSPMFTKDPKVNVSIICPDPDFRNTEEITLNGLTVEDGTETFVDYDGTVETGVVFRLLVNRPESQFTIYNLAPNNTSAVVDFSGTLIAGDILTISSIPGDKHVTLTRGGVDSSVLYGLSPQSGWVQFFPGENRLRVYATGVPIPYEVIYTTRYGGL